MADWNKAVTGHLIPFWGVPQRIVERRNVAAANFAVLEFGPGQPSASWRYVTNGMSSVPQTGEGAARTELYCATSSRCEWALDLLTLLASYPFEFDTAFGEGDTLEVEGPIDQAGSPYRGVMMVAPDPLDDERLGSFACRGVTALVHRVVGLLPDELRFAADGGGNEIRERLGRTRFPLLLDVNRQSVLP